MSETHILHAIRAALVGTRRCMIFRNNTGVDITRGVKYGLGVGSPDLVGCLGPRGRMFCIEVKVPGKKPSRDQVLWANALRKFGGFVAVATSPEEALVALDQAINETLSGGTL